MPSIQFLESKTRQCFLIPVNKWTLCTVVIVPIETFTCDHIFGPLLRKDVQVLQRNHASLYASKHGWEPETEEHDEKEDRPERRNRHLSDGLCEDYEGQTCSLHPLKNKNTVTCSTQQARVLRKKWNDISKLFIKPLKKPYFTEETPQAAGVKVQRLNDLWPRDCTVEILQHFIIVGLCDGPLSQVKGIEQHHDVPERDSLRIHKTGTGKSVRISTWTQISESRAHTRWGRSRTAVSHGSQWWSRWRWRHRQTCSH